MCRHDSLNNCHAVSLKCPYRRSVIKIIIDKFLKILISRIIISVLHALGSQYVFRIIND